MPTQKFSQKLGLLSYLMLLTALLILAEISFLLQYSSAYLGDFKYITNHLSVPLNILPGILLFILFQFLIHGGFALIIWGIAKLVGIALNFSTEKIEYFGIGLWFFALSIILLANRAFFPNSKFASLLFNKISLATVNKILIVGSSLLIPIVLLALCGLSLVIFRQIKKRKIISTSILVILTMIFIYDNFYLHSSAPTDAASDKKPNIIVIGIDSLRPDFLGFFGYPEQSPHIDKFLTHATVFSEALTPIARTFSAWTSILTGLYPKLNSIRTDLADANHLDIQETLPTLLREKGYHTIFATDETRFSNIDQRYGFDEVVLPPIGFNDFLLGTINDFPLSNLLINTKVGKYLFPNSYANRAAYPTYNPNSFLQLMKPVITKSRTKPTLLMVHFCLPHFPYAWASLPVKKLSLHHYQAAIKRADEQFYDFMRMLQDNNFLQHSIVVILSDHGEAVEMPGDRITAAELFRSVKNIPHFYPPSSTKEKVDMSGGHGTDVLSLSQYHIVLAFKTFGIKLNRQVIIPGIVSLLDIKPTLLSYLNLPLGRSSGNNLLPYIFDNKNIVNEYQDFFIESDFSPEAVRAIHPETRKVLLEGINYFRIDPITQRVFVKDSMMKMILASKQYADFYHSWVLALYPQNKKQMMPILVNLQTGEWTNDLTSEFAENSPAHHMLANMKIFFGDNLTSIIELCHASEGWHPE